MAPDQWVGPLLRYKLHWSLLTRGECELSMCKASLPVMAIYLKDIPLKLTDTCSPSYVTNLDQICATDAT